MKLALGQLTTTWFDSIKNKENCLKLVEKAKDQLCNIIFFPEMTLTGFSWDIKSVINCISPKDTFNFFKEIALKYSMYIGFGSVEKENSKYYNSYTILSPKGIVISKYYKVHPFSPGKENLLISPGDSISFCPIDNITLSTFICYDLRFPEVFQIASKKSQLIIVASAWPNARKEHWLTLLKARAIENQCYIAGINSYGYDLENQYYSGDSVIINANGEILSCCSDKEDLLTADIKAEEVFNIRKKFNVNEDRKNHTYLKYYKQFI